MLAAQLISFAADFNVRSFVTKYSFSEHFQICAVFVPSKKSTKLIYYGQPCLFAHFRSDTT
jgi:hypothetical protein